MNVFILFSLSIFGAIAARDVIVDFADYSPKESDLIDYGSLKLRKAKERNTFALSGNFTLKQSLGNEKLWVFEVQTRTGATLLKQVRPFCEFTRTEKSFWPDIIKLSNMPRDNPCPFPEGDYFISRFAFNDSRIPRGIGNGKYIIKIQMTEKGQTLLSFELHITLK